MKNKYFVHCSGRRPEHPARGTPLATQYPICWFPKDLVLWLDLKGGALIYNKKNNIN